MKSLVRVKGLCYDLEFGVSLPNFLWSPLDDAKFSRLQAIRPTPGAKVEDISLKTTWLKRREEWILQIPQRFKILTVYFTILWYQTLGFTPVCEVYVACFSHVRPLATSWTAAYQAPRSTGFSRQEYWSGVPSPSPIYTLLYIKLETDKNLLYSTGNSTWYSIMAYMGKESKKEWIYV